ncbi:MAG: cyclic nucleotide-binding domain-containing protein [Actinomycetes bacterium]
MTSPTVAELREVPLFSTLNDVQLQVVASFLSTESYRSGRSIVREGEVGYVFFVIKSGQADVTQGARVLRLLGPGDFFGEIAIVSEDGKRTATVSARTSVEVWAMVGTSFRQLQVKDPDVAQTLSVAIDNRLSNG